MLEALYREHRIWLFNWCTAMTGNPTLAEDLVQDTFLRAMGHLNELEDMSTGQRRAWLKRTAKNRYIDLVRRASNAPELEAEPIYMDDNSADEVETLCRTLPPEDYALFHMRYFEGYNATELGELFHLNPATVRARLAAARKKLKRLYLEE